MLAVPGRSETLHHRGHGGHGDAIVFRTNSILRVHRVLCGGEGLSVWILIAIGAGVLALAHTAPAPFLFDVIAGDRSRWHMPKRTPPTVYLTFDDGPNPTTTPDLLDVLAREGVHATFFLIDRHITDVTAPLVRRMFADGHAVALHSHTRAYMFMSPETFASTLTAAADHIEQVARRRPCRAFRPHA